MHWTTSPHPYLLYHLTQPFRLLYFLSTYPPPLHHLLIHPLHSIYLHVEVLLLRHQSLLYIVPVPINSTLPHQSSSTTSPGSPSLSRVVSIATHTRKSKSPSCIYKKLLYNQWKKSFICLARPDPRPPLYPLKRPPPSTIIFSSISYCSYSLDLWSLDIDLFPYFPFFLNFRIFSSIS